MPGTRETSERARLLRDNLQTEDGDTVTNRPTQRGVRRPNTVRGAGGRAFYPCCEDNHRFNGAYIKHIGGLFFKYTCLTPGSPREIELDLRRFQREPSQPQASKYLGPIWHILAKVISISSPFGSGKTTQIIADKDHRKPKRVLVVTCRRGMATNMTGRFEGFTSYLDVINKDM